MQIQLTKRKIFITKENIALYAVFMLMMVRYLIPVYYIGKMNSLIATSISYTSLFLMIGYVVINKVKISFASILLLLIYTEFVITTVINKASISSGVFSSVYIFSLCLMISAAKDRPKDIEMLLRVVRDVTLFFFCINFMYGLIMPKGIPEVTVSPLYPYFLYGNINASLRSILPGLCCSCILDYKKQKRISFYTFMFFIGFWYFCFRVYFMATGFIGMSLIFLWIVFSSVFKTHVRKIFITIVVIVFLFEIYIVFVGGNTTIASNINNFFGKTGSFSGRGLLWTNCLKAIHQKFLMGYGLQEADYVRFLIGNRVGSHNYYLDLLFQRGIVGFVMMIILIISPIFEKGTSINPIYYILIGFCSAYIIMFLAEPFIGTEVFHIPIFYITLVMIIENYKNKPLKWVIKRRI